MADLFETMRRRAEVRAEAQQAAANRADQRNTWISGIATVLAAIGGTSAFVSLQQATDRNLVIAAAFLSIAAAVVTGLQTLRNDAARVGQHRKWAAEASSLQMAIEFAQAQPADDALTEARYETFKRGLHKIDSDAPNVPHDLFEQAEREVEARYP